MTAHKPQKRHEALVPLSRDHHQGLLLCWKIRKGMQNDTKPESVAAYTRYFYEMHLKKHFQEEELYIFNHLNAEDQQRKKALNQHRRLNRLFEQLSEEHCSYVQTLWKIEETLESHIRFEERELFPYIEQNIPEEKLIEMGRKLDEIHDAFQECWNDEFWKR